MDWLSLGSTLLGGLFGNHQPKNPFAGTVNQYLPQYAGGQMAAYNELTSPSALQRNVAAYTEGTARAAQDATQVAMQRNAEMGGAGSNDMAANLVNARETNVAGYQRQAREQQLANQFNMGGQGIQSMGSLQGIGGQQQQEQQQQQQGQYGWMSQLPWLIKAFGHHATGGGVDPSSMGTLGMQVAAGL